MRVITPFGFGETASLKESPITVVLDEPFLDQKQIGMDKREVFLFSPWAVVKVLNIMGHGWFSNLQFHGSRAEAEMMLDFPSPPDETTFFLDLDSGSFKVNRDLGILAQNSFIMKLWVDRWAKEHTETFAFISKARESFREEKKESGGTTGGIEAFIHLDGEGGGNVLGFYLLITVPRGVVFEKEFDFKLRD